MTPFTKDPNRGDAVEHLKMGVTEFMMRNENLVRQKNEIIKSLEEDREKGWEEFIEGKMKALLENHREDVRDAERLTYTNCIWISVCFVILAFALGGVVEYYARFGF